MNYTVGDFVIRIKNAVLANRKRIVFPYSKLSKNLAHLLEKEGYLTMVKESQEDGKKVLTAQVMSDKRVPRFTDVKIISKPSLRIYSSIAQIENAIKRSIGIIVISSNSGLMTGREALKKGIGGEVLFEIW